MNIAELKEQISDLPANEGLEWIDKHFDGAVTFSTSFGQEDQVITDMIASRQLGVDIFTLDTGRLFNETIDVWQRTEDRYKLRIKSFYPDTSSVETLVNKNGINGFYNSTDNRKQCCYVRKVEPLKRALQGYQLWITGLRAEQSADRSDVQLLEWDEANKVIKYNPLISWSYDQVRGYLHSKEIPYNILHNMGYVSIGCAPCTRAIAVGEEPRAGRWWWESEHKECGLHIKQA